MAELKEVLEALVFVHRGPVTVKVLEGVLGEEWSREEIVEALGDLLRDFEEKQGVIRLVEVAGGFEFVTAEDFADYVRRMDHYEHHRHLSRPALETLAIVAYRQPVTRQEIEQIRGVNVERILRGLAEKKLVKTLGRKDVPGKPLVYGTTAEFLLYFGLAGLGDLPSLEEFTEQELPEGEGVDILPLDEEEAGGEPGEGSAEGSGAESGEEEVRESRPEGEGEPEG